MRSQGRGEHAMAEQRAVAAGARTGSLAGLAKSPWRGIGRRLSWSFKILRSGLNRPASGHRSPFPHIRSAILKGSQPRMAIPTPQKAASGPSSMGTAAAIRLELGDGRLSDKARRAFVFEGHSYAFARLAAITEATAQ
jgi:hypothetical protein